MAGPRRYVSLQELEDSGDEEAVSFGGFVSRLRALLGWLYPELRPYRWRVFGNWLLLVLLSAVSASPILLAKKIVEEFDKEEASLLLPLALLAGAIMAVSLLQFLGSFMVGQINFRLRHSMEVKYARRMASTPLSYYEGNTSGSIALAPFVQVPMLTRTVEILFRNFLQAGTTVAIVLAVLIYTNRSIGVYCAALVPMFFIGVNWFGRGIQRSVTRTFRHVSDMHSHILESLVSVKSIRTLGISEKRVSEASRKARETMRYEMRTLLLGGAMKLVMESVFAAGVVVAVLLLRAEFARGTMSLGLCAAVLTGFGLLAKETKMLAGGVIELRKIAGATAQVVHFLEQPADCTAAGTREGPRDVGGVFLEGVSFSYGTGAQVLKGVDMAFEKGRITGIIGASGAGKSTLADLVLRLRAPQAGRLVVDGVDLSEFSEEWLRRAFGFVGQEPFLFNATVRENLQLALPEDADGELERSLQAASAWEFVSALPQGLDTPVGEGGSLLSVGEKQRLALARALMKRPSVLVLDEITSAVDPANERAILEALRDLAPTAVLVLISHRETVAKFCHRIYRLEGGTAVPVKG